MKIEFSIVSECCPIGCVTEVFLTKCQKDNLIYLYCWACGALWKHPLAARWETYYDESLEIERELYNPQDYLPEGFTIPSDDEVCDAGLTEFVLFKMFDEGLESGFKEMNTMRDERTQELS